MERCKLSTRQFLYTKFKYSTNVNHAVLVFHEKIDEVALLEAVKKSVSLYPTLRYTYYEGDDFYLEMIDRPIEIYPLKDGVPVMIKETNGYPFAFVYEGDTLYIYLYHASVDGNTTRDFLKTFIYFYAKEKDGFEIQDEDLIISRTEEEMKRADLDFEDYFDMNKDYKGEKFMNAFGVKSEMKEPGYSNRFALILDEEETNAYCKEHGIRPYTILCSSVLRTIEKLYPERNGRPLCIGFPVNLRRKLGLLETTKNCVSDVSFLVPDCGDLSAEEYAPKLHEVILKSLRSEQSMYQMKNLINIINELDTIKRPFDTRRKAFLRTTLPRTYHISYWQHFTDSKDFEKYVKRVECWVPITSIGNYSVTVRYGGKICNYFSHLIDQEKYPQMLAQEIRDLGLSCELEIREPYLDGALELNKI